MSYILYSTIAFMWSYYFISLSRFSKYDLYFAKLILQIFDIYMCMYVLYSLRMQNPHV